MFSPMVPVPTVELRPLRPADIPRLSEIRPTYKSPTILVLEKQEAGTDLEINWTLAEEKLAQPFDKGSLYDFDAESQRQIQERLERPDDTYQRVADYEGKLVGILDAEIQYWNNTVTIWNLMVDLDYRGHGVGRRLWHRARDFAKQVEARAILIETQNTNVAACKFYMRMGCSLVGFHESYYANAGPEIALFWSYNLAPL